MRPCWRIIALLSLLAIAPGAHAYTLTVDIKQNELQLRMPLQRNLTGYAQEDVTIDIETRSMNGMPWRLQVLAPQDMLGPEAIPASELRWQALTAPFIDGQLVKGTPQLLARGTGDGKLSGRIRFLLKADNLRAGDYDIRLSFILSSP